MKRILLVLLVVAAAGSVSADDDWLVRVGAGDDPGQLLVGFQYEAGSIQQVRFRPDILLGVGDNEEILEATGSLQYFFPRRDNISPFAGAGPVMALVNRDRGPQGDDTDFELDLKLTAGVAWHRGSRLVTLEFNILFNDVYDFELLGGWSF